MDIRGKITNNDIWQWILNDERLYYACWVEAGGQMSNRRILKFIRENRNSLVAYIKAELARRPRA